MAGKRSDLQGIIDTHCHVLPAVDDGSESVEESLKMLKIAHKEGITHMICTSHYKAGRRNASAATLTKRREELQDLLKDQGIDIKLYPGNEVLYFSEMDEKLQEGSIFTINNTDYVLVEFLPGDRFLYIRNALEEVMGMGYKPVIAHIERYECMVKHPEYVSELNSMGVKIQVNASSIMGKAGSGVKKGVRHMLEEGLVDYIGTDAHKCKGRTPSIKKCVKYLYKKYDGEYVDEILYNNARRDFLL